MEHPFLRIYNPSSGIILQVQFEIIKLAEVKPPPL